MPLPLSPLRRFAFALCGLLLGLAPATPVLAQTCPFDDGSAKLGVEGVILTRYALGMTGAALVAGTGISAADAPIVEATASCPSCGLNITGNATMTVTDATIISRKIAGLKGAALTNGLNLGTGTRNTSAAVQTFLLGGCGNVNVPATCNTNQIIKWNGDAWACADAIPLCEFGQAMTGNGFGGIQCSLPANVITTVDNSAAVGSYSAIAVSALDGFPVIAYFDSTNGDLKVLRCSNSACTGSVTINTVDSTGIVGASPAIILSSSGLPRISYYDGTNGDLKVAYCTNASCSGSTLYTVDSAGIVGQGSSIAIGSSGNITISYRDVSNSTVKIARCAASNCSTPAITTVDAAASSYETTSVVLSASGNPIIAYVYTPLAVNNIRVAVCSDPACSSAPTFSGFTTSNSLDQVSLALSPAGIPTFSFHDVTNGDLRVTACFSTICDSGTITTTPDVTGVVGLYSSIAVAPDGRPVVAYLDATNGDLKVLKCGNSQCNFKNRVSTVDSTGIVGSRPSLVLPKDGLPIISYYDATNSALKVVKCANEACAP